MKDAEGKLLTSEDDIKAEAIKHYKKVFQKNAIEKDLKPHEVEREQLCKERLKIAYENKTPPWTLLDVKNAIKGLNKAKAISAKLLV